MGNIGWTEIIIILAVALIIFGPRKLPQLGKSLGESLAQFRRASEGFKHTWETEVEIEQRRLSSVNANDTISYKSSPTSDSEAQEYALRPDQQVAVTELHHEV